MVTTIFVKSLIIHILWCENILIDILLIATQSPHTSQSLRFVKWVKRKTNIFLSCHTHKHTHTDTQVYNNNI